MRKYILDTNVIVHIVNNTSVWKYIEEQFQPLDLPNRSFISMVSIAELLAIAQRRNWGKRKMGLIQELLTDKINHLELSMDMIPHYVDIQNYSQGYHSKFKLPRGISARNMGKHDMWIAATAQKAKAELITTDKDFVHLNHIFCKIHYVDVERLKNA